MKKPPTEQQVDPILLSMVRIELLSFFQANPYTRDTIEGLSRRLHRPLPAVSLAVSSLAALGILAGRQGSGTTVYHLKTGQFITPDTEEGGEKEYFSGTPSNQAHQSKADEGKKSKDQLIS